MGLILHGILNAPYSDDPSDIGVVEWYQMRAAMREASIAIDVMHTALGGILDESDLERAKAIAVTALQDHEHGWHRG